MATTHTIHTTATAVDSLSDTSMPPLPQLYPLRFTPRYFPRIWGGSRLAPAADDGTPIGEAWLISSMPDAETSVAEGALAGLSLSELTARYGDALLGDGASARGLVRFPLLIKILDAQQDLSVQVHPSSGEERKEEFWYFLETTPESRVCNGLKEVVSTDQLASILAQETIEDWLLWEPVSIGGTLYLPAGRIHALGAGTLLIEVQDASDTTYRLFDYHRLDTTGVSRQLHITEALRSARLDLPTPEEKALPLEATHFVCSTQTIRPSQPTLLSVAGSLAIVVGIAGEITLHYGGCDYTLRPHEALLLPASLGACELRAEGSESAQLLMVTHRL